MNQKSEKPTRGIWAQNTFRLFKDAMVLKEHYQIVISAKAFGKGHALIRKYGLNCVRNLTNLM